MTVRLRRINLHRCLELEDCLRLLLLSHQGVAQIVVVDGRTGIELHRVTEVFLRVLAVAPTFSNDSQKVVTFGAILPARKGAS